MRRIGIAVLIAAAALATVVIFGGTEAERGRTGQDRAGPRATPPGVTGR